MIRVWGRRSSVNVQKVLWTLGELGLTFTRETVGGSFGGNRDADFLRMNPNGLVPVLHDGDVTMFESNAIVRYLCAEYGAGTMRPSDRVQLAAAEQWMEWQQTTLAPAVATIFWNNVRMPAAKRNGEAVAEAEKLAIAALHIADDHLAKNVWFAGSQFTFGDIVMGAFMWRYMGLDCTKPEIPHVAAWFEALKERKAYRQWVMVAVGRNLEEWTKYERELG